MPDLLQPLAPAATALVVAVFLTGCSSISLEETAATAPVSPAADSRFAKLKLGMDLPQVTRLIGPYDGMVGSETAKRWIPFYLGNDARRGIALYKGEGCLTFTGGNFWSAGGNELIRIEVDPTGKCYQP